MAKTQPSTIEIMREFEYKLGHLVGRLAVGEAEDAAEALAFWKRVDRLWQTLPALLDPTP